MDRMIEEIGGFYPTHHEWDWLWSSMLFTPDLTSYPPHDIGGWCWSPLKGAIASPGALVGLGSNAYGPAMTFYNNTDPTGTGGLWHWSVLDDTFGMTPPLGQWSVAFGVDKRGGHTGNIALVTLSVYLGWNHKITYHTVGGGSVNYKLQDLPTVVGAFPPLGQQETPCTVVVTSRQAKDLVIYANGQEIGRAAAGGTGLYVLNRVQIGGNLANKQNACWGGAIGPFVLSRHTWSPAQVAQWSADPWGYLRPAVHPIPYPIEAIDALEFDTRTGRAVDFDARARRAVDFDSRTRRAVNFDARSRRAVDFDVRTRRAVDFDVQTRPKEN